MRLCLNILKTKHTSKILWCEHRNILKLCLAMIERVKPKRDRVNVKLQSSAENL